MQRQSYQPDDEKPKQQQLIDNFEEKLGEFNTLLPKHLHGHIPAHLLKQIPIVPAGYDDPNLPGHDDWLSKFWLKNLHSLFRKCKNCTFENYRRQTYREPKQRDNATSPATYQHEGSIGSYHRSCTG